jgi:plasmid maintenance system killer protein
MRLNTNKCKVMHVTNDQDNIAPIIILNGTELEVVNSYKYLGVEINTELNWNQQWLRVKSLIRSVPFLIKQLKRTGFNKKILVNVYRSLVLSHFDYSSPLLASAAGADKHEMQAFQNRIFRIIGISKQHALEQFKLNDVDAFIEKTAVNKVKKILSDPHHVLRSKLTKIHARTGERVLNVPKSRTEKHKNSIIPKCLRILRDGTANLYTTSSQPVKKRGKTAREATTEKPKTKKPKIGDTLCEHCHAFTGKLYVGARGLRTHQRSCKLALLAKVRPESNSTARN